MKNVKINFALAMIIIVIISLGAVLCGVGVSILSGTVDETVSGLEETRLSDDEIDDVEGYGLIFGYFGAGSFDMSMFGVALVLVLEIIYSARNTFTDRILV